MSGYLNEFPTGWFWNNNLWWGRELNEHTTISRGAGLELPDVRTADASFLINLRQQTLNLLSCLGDNNALQVQWTVGDDYYDDLARFDRITATSPGMTRWCNDRRAKRTELYRRKIALGLLRREQVHIYLAERCHNLKGAEMKNLAACQSYLESIAATLNAQLHTMEMNFPVANWRLHDDAGHYEHIARFLNPSLDQAISAKEAFTPDGLDTSRSIRANCMASSVCPFAYGRGENAGTGLQYDGMFHALFVLTRLPSSTRPGMMLGLLSANSRHCSITQNIQPIPIAPEMEKLRAEITELNRSLGDTKSTGVDRMILDKRNRIDALQSSLVVPFKVLTVVRVWDDSPDKLVARALATKTALQKLNGIGVHEVNDPARARHIFLETLPGNLGGNYRDWDKYIENRNLADMLPLTSTFTGHIPEAQALLDTDSGSIAGIRFWAGADLTPQATTVTGQSGAGKTSLVIELLSQIEHEIDYIYLQEEGMALATYAIIRGIPSIGLKESSEYTLNPFDTFGLPYSSANISTVTKTAMKLLGVSRDEDKNKERENIISLYAGILFERTAQVYKDRDENRWADLTRMTMACDKLRKRNDDVIDGYNNLKALRGARPDEAKALEATFNDEQITTYQTSVSSQALLNQMVFTQLKPDDETYPTWSEFCSLMTGGREKSHKRGRMGDEMDTIVTALRAGKRAGGTLGGLIDGVTNVPLFGKGLHFDTSYLSEGMLKEVAGFLFPEMVRKHVMTMPRSALKLMFLDELRRLLLIPGSERFVHEMLAQLRKYRACFIGAFQSPSQIDDISPALSAVLMGQCKQHFLLRQSELGEIEKIARSIGLPPSAQRAIFQHPLIEHQPKAKACYFTLFANEGDGKTTCGTVRAEVDAETLYVATSSGEVFDRKMEVLDSYDDPVQGVYEEVARARREKEAEKQRKEAGVPA
jgi:hypothetical protein